MKKYNTILEQTITLDSSHKELIEKLDSDEWKIVVSTDDQDQMQGFVDVFRAFDPINTFNIKALGNDNGVLLISLDKKTTDILQEIHDINIKPNFHL